MREENKKVKEVLEVKEGVALPFSLEEVLERLQLDIVITDTYIPKPSESEAASVTAVLESNRKVSFWASYPTYRENETSPHQSCPSTKLLRKTRIRTNANSVINFDFGGRNGESIIVSACVGGEEAITDILPVPTPYAQRQ